MKQYGDITKLSGYDLDPVDLIVGGSPCQDLSVAGKRAGLDGERSGLFMEMIRIIKEMREKTNGIYPRFTLWENVPGALSSGKPKGADFGAVLGEFARVAEPDAPDVPVPEKGWAKSGVLLGTDWSLAWRITDAQYWGKTIRDSRTGNVLALGTPQRRRRLALVADFRGQSAPEILFERKSLSGDIEPGKAQREDTAGTSADSTGKASVYDAYQHHGYREGKVINPLTSGNNTTVRGDTTSVVSPKDTGETGKCLNPWDVQSKHIQPENGIAEALYSGECRYGGGESYVLHHEPIIIEMTSTKNTVSEGGTSPTLTARMGTGGNQVNAVLSFQERSGKPGGGKGILIQEDHVGALSTLNNQMVLDDQNNGETVYCLAGNGIDRADTAGCNGKGWKEDVSYTLNTIDRPAVYDPSVHHDYRQFDDVSETVRSRYGTGGNNQPLVVAIGNGQLNQISMSDKANALDTMHDQQCVMTFEAFGVDAERQTGSSLKARNYGVSNCDVVVSALCADDYKGPNRQYVDSGKCQITNNSVRRLTPLECSRLQGYPDGWVDIPGASDSAKYKALGNSICLPAWEFWARRFVRIGVVKTIGSLFDGIGGFPLVFLRAGAETLWTSEIEPFCQKVVEYHFGNEETGKEGDVWKYLK